MKKVGFLPALIWGGALLWAICSPAGIAWSEPEARTSTLDASQALSRPDWYRSLIQKGHASERLGQKQDALADYTLAIESHVLGDAEQTQVLFARGQLLDGMGRLKDALADYNSVLSMSPDFAAAHNSRADIYRRLGQTTTDRGDLTAAADSYGRAPPIDPPVTLADDGPGALASRRESLHPEHPASMSEESRNILAASPRRQRPDVQVQLGAWRSEQNAAKGWDHARALASEVLGGAAPRIVVVDLPGVGRFYRLRVGAGQIGSRELCVALAAKGLDCILVHD